MFIDGANLYTAAKALGFPTITVMQLLRRQAWELEPAVEARHRRRE